MALSDTQLAPPARPAHQRVRYVGIDLARFIAIAGMMAAHLLAPLAMFPGVSDSDRELAMGTSLISNGAPAALFAGLGGVSIVFATRKQLSGGLVGKAMASVAVRGVVLIVLGVLLGFVDNNIIVILAYYGVAMILVAPLIKAKSWVLASLAAVLGLGFGWLNITLRRSLEVLADRGTDVAEFDGHVSDPHFLPVWTRLSPDGRWFHLVEVPADGPG